MKKRILQYKEFILYATVNGAVTIFNLLLYWFFYAQLRLPYIISNILSYILATVAAGILNYYIVFGVYGKPILKFAFFGVFKIIMGIANTFCLYVFVDLIGMSEYIGFLAVTVCFFVVSYFFNHKIYRLR